MTPISTHIFYYLLAYSTLTTAALPNPFSVSKTTKLTSLVALSLPQTSSNAQLPTANTTLLHVTLGHGIQNYTCAASTSKPVAVGALATLYDISSYSEDDIVAMPPIAAYLALPNSPATPLSVTAPLRIVAGVSSTLSVLGYHYFQSDGTPTFNLSTTSQILYAKKQADIPAPIDASPGANGMGAVDWLYLADKGQSVGLGGVYRVVTAGGMPTASCDALVGGGTMTVPYAALYWLYQ